MSPLLFSSRTSTPGEPDTVSGGPSRPTLSDLLKSSPADVSIHLPRGPHHVLSFTDLTYTIKTPSARHHTARKKAILDSITGEARQGEILAILGASGSGKSTLIDALANRISHQNLKGSIALNSHPLDRRLLKPLSAYVMQDDLLFPMLTVQETLAFSADFRLARSLSASKKSSRVHSLIDQLGLRSAAHTIIGDEGHRGISGGERRRVSIGVEIVHDPVLLFLDEPTSGLDSSSAFTVVRVLQKIARGGSIVIMSIHQPSFRILGLLDSLIFLSRGRPAYTGSPRNLPPFLAEFGRPIPPNENWAEFTLDLIQDLDSDAERMVRLNKSRFRPSPRHLSAVLETRFTSTTPTFANPMYREILILTRRSITNSRRMPELILVRLGAVLVTGFILATVFWRLDDSPSGATERLGFFAFTMSTTYFTCAEALPVFLQERYIFMRETAHNAYRRSSYVLSNAAVSLPSLLLLSFALSLTTFFAVGLAGGVSGFGFFFLTVLSAFWAGSSFVTFLSGIVTQVMVGYTVVVATLAYFLLFSGFFISKKRMPGYWVWFHYMSLVKYPYEGVMRSEFGGRGGEGRCFARGVEIFDGTMMEGLERGVKVRALAAISEAVGVGIGERTCVTTGGDLLGQQGVTELGKWECVLVTVAWGVFFRVLFYFALLVGSKNKRK